MKFDEAQQLKAPCTQDLQYCPGTGVHVEGDSSTPGGESIHVGRDLKVHPGPTGTQCGKDTGAVRPCLEN